MAVPALRRPACPDAKIGRMTPKLLSLSAALLAGAAIGGCGGSGESDVDLDRVARERQAEQRERDRIAALERRQLATRSEHLPNLIAIGRWGK